MAYLREIQGNLDDAIHYFKLHIKNSFDSKSLQTTMSQLNGASARRKLIG